MSLTQSEIAFLVGLLDEPLGHPIDPNNKVRMIETLYTFWGQRSKDQFFELVLDIGESATLVKNLDRLRLHVCEITEKDKNYVVNKIRSCFLGGATASSRYIWKHYIYVLNSAIRLVRHGLFVCYTLIKRYWPGS